MLIDEIPIPISMSRLFWHTHNETHNKQSKKEALESNKKQIDDSTWRKQKYTRS